MTITLHGFRVSNYHNKVRLVLLEKGIPHEERDVHPRDFTDADKAATPLGKVPFLTTPQGTLCESAVICEYLEAIAPEPRLIPADPFAAAKVRELNTFIELHLELLVREIYPKAFFGGNCSDETLERVKTKLPKHVAAFKKLAKFSPYVAGDTFTVADCAAWITLPLVAMASRIVYGEDALAAAGIDWKPYIKLIDQRPAAARVAADRKAAQDAAAGK